MYGDVYKIEICSVTVPVLGYPDPEKPYILDTDASECG